LPGVTVGVKSVVSAGSVVVNNVNDFTLVAGNPAKKVAEFDSLLD
jgi:tetrahydrodipicolinate N-acetyltransferase